MDYIRFTFLSFMVSFIITVFVSGIFGSNFSTPFCGFLFFVFLVTQIIKNIKDKKNKKQISTNNDNTNTFIQVFLVPLAIFIFSLVGILTYMNKVVSKDHNPLVGIFFLFVFVVVILPSVTSVSVGISVKNSQQKDSPQNTEATNDKSHMSILFIILSYAPLLGLIILYLLLQLWWWY